MPETMEHIGEIFRSGLLDQYEKHIVMWQFRLLGDFEMALMGAILRADDNNLMALSLGFPLEVYAFRQWMHGDMGQRLRSLGLEI